MLKVKYILIGFGLTAVLFACFPEEAAVLPDDPKDIFGVEISYSIQKEENCGAPCLVQIIDSSSASEIESYSWNFGDPGNQDNLSNDKNPQHLYKQAGTYDISLELTLNSKYSNHVIRKDTSVEISYVFAEQIYNNYNGMATDIIELSDPNGGYLIVGTGGQAFQIDKNGQANNSFDDWPSASGNTDQNPLANFYHVIELENGVFVAAENVPVTFFKRSEAGIVLINNNGSYNNRKLLSDLDPKLDSANITDLQKGDNGTYYLTGTFYSSSADTGGIFLMRGENLQEPEIITTYSSNKNGRYTGGKTAINPNGKVYVSGLDPDNIPLLFAWEEAIGKNAIELIINPNTTGQTAKALPMAIDATGNLISLIGFKEIELRKADIGFDGVIRNPELVETNSQGYDKVLSMNIIPTQGNGFAGVALLYNEQEIDKATGLFVIRDQNTDLTKVNTGGTTTADHLFSIIQTRDGGFAMVGSRNGKFFFKKTDSIGN